MRITIACVGKARGGPESDLFETYIRRLPWQVQVKEVEAGRGLSVERRCEREGELLLAAVPTGAKLVALDEDGRQPSSGEFAEMLKKWQESGHREVAFLIGGADGHGPAIHQQADVKLAFGRLTWPHLMVRPMLAEQLYRAHTILTGHPYHRS